MSLGMLRRVVWHCCLHLQSSRRLFFFPKGGSVWSLVNCRQTTRRHIPAQTKLRSHRSEKPQTSTTLNTSLTTSKFRPVTIIATEVYAKFHQGTEGRSITSAPPFTCLALTVH
jgi:hypothetical protein